MENKSKLSRLTLTRVMLQALLMLLAAPNSAFAATEANQEIGVPQPMESKIKDCFGAYLSPNEDRFYTLREGMLTQYQINPFKKLGSVAIEPQAINKDDCHVLVSNDEKKLIVVSRFWIYTFDTSTGRLLKKSEWKYRPSAATIINDGELLILGRYFLGQEDNGKNVVDLDIWDINTLTLKKKLPQFGENFEFVQDSGGFPAMSKIQDRIYMRTERSLVVVNSKTYEPELSLSIGPASNPPAKFDPRHPETLLYPTSSKDLQTLYVGHVKKITDYVTGKQTSFDEIKYDSVLVFDQKTRKFRIDNYKNLQLDELAPFLFLLNQLNMSRNKNYLMILRNPYEAMATLIKLNTNERGIFYQYEAGEAIQQRCTIGSFKDCKEFQLTPGARKYLMMDENARIPINDATFAKYYRTEFTP